eukprot:2334567-Amphidinium_carterae.1
MHSVVRVDWFFLEGSGWWIGGKLARLQAKQAGLFVINATQIVESMIENPVPTRAEVCPITTQHAGQDIYIYPFIGTVVAVVNAKSGINRMLADFCSLCTIVGAAGQMPSCPSLRRQQALCQRLQPDLNISG